MQPPRPEPSLHRLARLRLHLHPLRLAIDRHLAKLHDLTLSGSRHLVVSTRSRPPRASVPTP